MCECTRGLCATAVPMQSLLLLLLLMLLVLVYSGSYSFYQLHEHSSHRSPAPAGGPARKKNKKLPNGAIFSDFVPTYTYVYMYAPTTKPPLLSGKHSARTVLHQGVLALGEHVADGRGPRLEPLGAQPLGVLHHVGVPADELVGQGVPRQLERLDAV